MARSLLHIGELAKLLGVTPKTVRHYHKLGLLHEAERSEGGYRLYDADDLTHLQRIRRLQSLGLSLQQIKFILDSDDSDTLLRETLRALSGEIGGQIQKLQARRERIENFLAEDGTLKALVKPDSTSPTYSMMKSILHEFRVDVPEEMLQQDLAIFAQLDSYEWPEGYREEWRAVGEYLAAHPEQYRGLLAIGERMAAIVNLPEDAPEIPILARDIAQMGVLQWLDTTLPEATSIPRPIRGVLEDVIISTADEVLTPAQRRLMALLGEELHQKDGLNHQGTKNTKKED